MDYLTDPDWMMRKLTINIVYTLVYYCRSEIMEVKDNIVESLNVLKIDENEEIQQVCKNILNLLQIDNDKNDDIDVINDLDNTNTIKTNQSYKSNLSNGTNNNNNKTNQKNKKIKNNNTLLNNKTFDKSEIEELDNKINIILAEIKKINEEQTNFREKLDNLIQKEQNNYNTLNQRFSLIEKFVNKNNESKTNNRRIKLYKYKDPKIDEEKKIENLKKKFNDGNYNEALIDTKQNDKYLLKILPLIEKNNIPKIEIAILEDTISRINKRIYILCMEQGIDSINDILIFYNELIQAKIKIKLITKMRIKDAMNFLKSKGNNFIENDEMDNIDNIIKNLNLNLKSK